MYSQLELLSAGETYNGATVMPTRGKSNQIAPEGSHGLQRPQTAKRFSRYSSSSWGGPLRGTTSSVPADLSSSVNPSTLSDSK